MKIALIEKEVKLMSDGKKSHVTRLIDNSIGENIISTTIGKSIPLNKLREKLHRWGYTTKLVDSVQLVNLSKETRSWVLEQFKLERESRSWM